MIAIGIALAFAIIYLLLQLYYLIHWHRTPQYVMPAQNAIEKGVSVVVVSRNEEKTIAACIQSLLDQAFPDDLYEILIINDHSTDQTVNIIERFENSHIHLYHLEDFPAFIRKQAYKKSGITLGVHKSSFETIVVTDADCIHPERWLASMVQYLESKDLVFATAPVILQEGKSLLEKMQETEQLTLMAVTGAGMVSGFHDLANGANMCFRKSAFLAVNGYEGNEHFASGDDMFLVEKMRYAYRDKIGFVKSLDATVQTNAKKTWATLFNQRLRWAGKNKGLKNKSIDQVWTFIGAYHVAMLLFLAIALVKITSPWPFIIMLIVKWTMDYMLIAMSASFFKRTSLLKYFVPLQFYYTYYVMVMGFKMLLRKEGDWRR
jgi:cellulose synthase/poly-beta-1,6-N-acetylglucosamine synthase-like glycosyltransferase